LAAIGCHSLAIYRVILLSLLPKSQCRPGLACSRLTVCCSASPSDRRCLISKAAWAWPRGRAPSLRAAVHLSA
jgi:hypothetical protein